MAACSILQKRTLYIAVSVQLVIILCLYMLNLKFNEVFRDSGHLAPNFKVVKGAKASVRIRTNKQTEDGSSIKHALKELNDVIYDGDYETEYKNYENMLHWREDPDYLLADGALPAHQRSNGKANTTALRDILAGLNDVIYEGDYDDDNLADYWVIDEYDGSKEASSILGRAWRRLQELWQRGISKSSDIPPDIRYQEFIKWTVNGSLVSETNSSAILKKANEYREQLNKVIEELDESSSWTQSTESPEGPDYPSPTPEQAVVSDGITLDIKQATETDDAYSAYKVFMDNMASCLEKIGNGTWDKSPRTQSIFTQLKRGPLASRKIVTDIIRDNNENKAFTKPPSKTDSPSACWMSDDGLNCQPAGYVFGFRRCASSDLFYRLTGHPQLVFTTELQNNHYQRDGTKESITGQSRKFGILSYVQGHVSKHAIILARSPTRKFVYHMPPSVTKRPQYHDYYNMLRAQALYEVNPKAKFIVIMRNPVDAAFSTYGAERLFMTSRGKTTTRWSMLVKNAVTPYQDCIRTRGIFYCHRQPPYSMTMIKVNLLDFAYIIGLSHWMKIFPREQFYFIKTEEYAEVEKRQKILDEAFKFLGGRNLSDSDLETLAAMHRLDFASMKYTSPKLLKQGMDSKTRKILQDFFMPFNSALANLLQDKRFLWTGD
ncbi:uncharacterized protein LOC135483035 [Lineus longissimus]|uniref:uncharacterized protein LOC135483035 n=1 Tax=Lineus longissimus TaxID=88925 RepID=UPI00315DFFF8